MFLLGKVLPLDEYKSHEGKITSSFRVCPILHYNIDLLLEVNEKDIFNTGGTDQRDNRDDDDDDTMNENQLGAI